MFNTQLKNYLCVCTTVGVHMLSCVMHMLYCRCAPALLWHIHMLYWRCGHARLWCVWYAHALLTVCTSSTLFCICKRFLIQLAHLLVLTGKAQLPLTDIGGLKSAHPNYMKEKSELSRSHRVVLKFYVHFHRDKTSNTETHI